MYTIILVEDEYDIRKAIIRIIDWNRLGFDIVGDAENGQQALELVDQLRPDVIITDIKMPFMDGLELVKQLRENYPIVKTVFLTGLSDFEYAKSAIQYNVMDYILKPVTAKKLEEALNKIRETMDKEAEQLRNSKQLEALYRESLPEIRLGFLISLVTSRQGTKATESRTRQLDIKWEGDSFMVAVVRLHVPGQAEELTAKADLILPSLNRYVQRCCQRVFSAQCFPFQGNIVCLLSGTVQSFAENTDSLFSEICQYSRKITGFFAYAGIGRTFESLTKARDGFESAVAALRYRPVSGKDNIIHIADMEKEDKVRLLFAEEDERKLSSLIKTAGSEEARAFIESCFTNCVESGASVSDYHIMLVEMFLVLAKTAKASIPDLELNVGNNLDFMTQLYRTETMEEAKIWFIRLCISVMGLISQQRLDTVQDLGERALYLIRSQFSDPTLTLKEAASRLHISSTYLGSVIKKHTGNSFTNLLIDARMTKAKELILGTGKKIFEVAEETGYQNQHYFSYCFKMYYGVSPNEMRTNSRKEQEDEQADKSL